MGRAILPTQDQPSASNNSCGNMKLKDLHPSKSNPRSITENRLVLLGGSLEEYGDLSGIVFNSRTKTLVTGHQRAKAIAGKNGKIISSPQKDKHGTVELGEIEVQLKNGKIKIPFRMVDWDKERQKAANIAANAHGGKFDNDKLAIIIKELSVDKFDVESTGLEPLLIKELAIIKNASPAKSVEPIKDTEIKFKHTCPKCKHRF